MARPYFIMFQRAPPTYAQKASFLMGMKTPGVVIRHKRRSLGHNAITRPF